jgi:hypothetical protein
MELSEILERIFSTEAVLFATAVAVAISTVLDRYLEYYKPDDPGLKKLLRFIIDLLSILPSKGHSLKRGLQPPILGSSGPPPKETDVAGTFS